MARHVLLCLAFLAASCGGPRDEPPAEPAPSPRPNVIIITMDNFRADRLAMRGGHPHVAPFLNALTSSAVVFDNAITPLGHTHPAHTSLHTGLMPRTHGVLTNQLPPAGEMTTLAEYLRQKGYETAAFVQSGAMLEKAGLAQGFDVSYETGRFHTSAEVNRKAQQWMRERNPDRPFFLWQHYFETHLFEATDYSAPTLELLGGPLGCGAPYALLAQYRDRPMPITDGLYRASMDIIYDGKVLVTNDLVQDTLGNAAARGMLGNTLTIVTADHGTRLGEHSDDPRSRVVWEEVMHVPLLFLLPDRRHEIIDTRVSLVDITPTILDWLKIEPEQPLQGRSLVPALEGRPLPEIVLVASTSPPRGTGTPTLVPELVAGWFGHHKIRFDGEVAELYDLEQDPREQSPLAQNEVPANLRDRLLDAVRTYREPLAR